MYAVLGSVCKLDLLVFAVTDCIILLVSLDVRLESVSLAISHQDSNFRMVLWNLYWTKSLTEHLRDLRNRGLYLSNRCFSFFQLTRATCACLRDWGVRHIVLLIKLLQRPCKWPLKLPVSTGWIPTWLNHILTEEISSVSFPSDVNWVAVLLRASECLAPTSLTWGQGKWIPLD